MTSKATREGLDVEIDPEKCDPETREAFIQASIKGARLRFK